MPHMSDQALIADFIDTFGSEPTLDLFQKMAQMLNQRDDLLAMFEVMYRNVRTRGTLSPHAMLALHEIVEKVFYIHEEDAEAINRLATERQKEAAFVSHNQAREFLTAMLGAEKASEIIESSPSTRLPDIDIVKRHRN